MLWGRVFGKLCSGEGIPEKLFRRMLLRENVAPEKVIPEKVIPEKVIPE
jgi:hypothetical protein